MWILGRRSSWLQAGLSVAVNQVKVVYKYRLSFQNPNPAWLHKPKQEEGFFSFFSDRTKLLSQLDPGYGNTPREARSLPEFVPFPQLLPCARFWQNVAFFISLIVTIMQSFLSFL